ncbi:MAG: NAD(P)-dependent oxidoreductase [Myxococcota bacterium]
MTRIGLIGASGTLGRVMVQQLAAEPSHHQLRALIRRDDPELTAAAQCTLAPNGVLDAAALSTFVADCDVVINLAARNPAGQENDLRALESFMCVNGLGAAVVAKTCAEANTPLLHFSSVAVYETHAYTGAGSLDESSGLPSLDDESTEYFEAALAWIRSVLASNDGDLQPSFVRRMSEHTYPKHAPVYGLTKLIGERAVVETPGRSCSIRLSDVFGPGHESRGVVIDHLRGLDRAALTANLDFRSTAHLIDINDVVVASNALATRLVDGPELPPILNLAGHCTDEPTLASALQALADAEGLSVRVTPASGEGVEKFDRRYDPTLLAATLPDFTLSPFAQSLQNTWAALKKTTS